MHAMWRPRKFGWVYIAACLYTFTLTMPNSISVYWAHGDQMLTKSNALGVLPPSTYRDIAIILMIIHQIRLKIFKGVYFYIYVGKQV